MLSTTGVGAAIAMTWLVGAIAPGPGPAWKRGCLVVPLTAYDLGFLVSELPIPGMPVEIRVGLHENILTIQHEL